MEMINRNIVFCKGETEKARLVKFESSKKTAWLPKSSFKIIDSKINSMTCREVYKIQIEKWAFNKIKYI
jgi:hypothetical protein